MDTVSRQKRSWIMSRVRGKDTQPERQVRKFVHALGLRYRLHSANLPGKPDLVFPRWRKAIFVHGCFWHGHEGCNRWRLPKANRSYWRAKIARNRQRDAGHLLFLRRLGWKTLVVWECELAKPMTAGRIIMRFFNA